MKINISPSVTSYTHKRRPKTDLFSTSFVHVIPAFKASFCHKTVLYFGMSKPPLKDYVRIYEHYKYVGPPYCWPEMYAGRALHAAPW